MINLLAGMLLLGMGFGCVRLNKITSVEKYKVIAGQKKKLVWADEFTGSRINRQKWEFEVGNNWYNNELQAYTESPENAYIQDGKLCIRALAKPYLDKDYTSARLRTTVKNAWTYGHLEIRAKLPQGQGLWPTIWMLPVAEVVGKVNLSNAEIDILEMVGRVPAKIHGTIHYGRNRQIPKEAGGTYQLAQGTFADDFHVFAITWEKDKVTWWVDNNAYFEVTAAKIVPGFYPLNQAFYLIINLAVGGSWPGTPDQTTRFPQQLEIDYVRMYQ